MKLNFTAQKWLKCFHLYAACVWVGSATVLSILTIRIEPASGAELFGILSTLEFIDLYILFPGAIGILLSGIIYSSWTDWGWFRQKWIVVKWAICIFGIVFGTFWLGPWLSEMVRIAEAKGIDALTDLRYVGNHKNFSIFGSIQAAAIVFAGIISILKPWKKKERVDHDCISHEENGTSPAARR